MQDGVAYKVKDMEKTEGVTYTIEDGMASQPGYMNASAENTYEWPGTPAQYADQLKNTIENQGGGPDGAKGGLPQKSTKSAYEPLVYYKGMETFDRAATKNMGDTINFQWDNGKGMTYQFKVGDISLSSDIDIKGHIEGSIYVLSDFRIGELQLNWNQAFWTRGNSPYKINAHMEEWKPVPKCTRDGRDKEKNDNKESDTPYVPDQPLDDGNTNSGGEDGGTDDGGRDKNQPGDSGADIVLSSYNIFLSPGQTDKIKLSIEDARFESVNTNIAAVDADGVVTGVAEGSTIVDVYDKEGSLAASIAVQVD